MAFLDKPYRAFRSGNGVLASRSHTNHGPSQIDQRIAFFKKSRPKKKENRTRFEENMTGINPDLEGYAPGKAQAGSKSVITAPAGSSIAQ